MSQDAALEPDPLLKNVPPHSYEAERSVLGALLIDPRSIDDVAQVIKGAEDFYHSAHGYVYQAILEQWRRNQPVDVLLVAENLEARGVLEEVGGAVILAELCEVVPSAANAEYYANIVRDRSIQRHLIRVSAELQKDAFETTDTVDALLDRTEKAVFELTQRRIRSEAVVVGEVVKEAYDQLLAREAGHNVSGLQSHFNDLDEITSGFLPGEMTILAARPSMGKTSFALNVMRNIVLHGGSACFFSLEMPKIQVTTNMICGIAKINGHRLRSGYLTKEEKRSFMQACDVLEPAQLYIDDSPTLSTTELRAKGRRLKANRGIDIIMIDYMQLMTGSAKAAGESRQMEVSEISRQVKALARELEIPIVCLAQLSRKVEERKEKIPMMSDLRESGSIEQDADKILLLYRPEYYEPDKEELRNKAKVIVAKNRNGPTGQVDMLFLRDFMRFECQGR